MCSREVMWQMKTLYLPYPNGCGHKTYQGGNSKFAWPLNKVVLWGYEVVLWGYEIN